MKKRINALLDRSKESHRLPGAYPFLPNIIAVLQEMLNNINATQEVRYRNSAALGRLVLEDFSFSSSQLGSDLLGLADDFAQPHAEQG